MHHERFLSIDAFRGLTVAAMLLVNNPGSWSHVYPPLRHAAWHGWTVTDLISPFFLFIVGLVIPFSFGRRMREGTPASGLISKVFKRSAVIFLLGFLLNLFPSFDFSTVRIPGVLQRIALCYLAGALVYLKTKPAGRLALSIVLLAGYTALLRFVPVPGFGPGILEPVGNLPGYVDAKLLAGHLLRTDFDPEGLLSTLPAVVTVLLGTMLGDWMRSFRTIFRKTLGVFSAGIPLTAAGFLLHPYLPINKSLWTGSYVLFTAGMALIVFGLCFVLIEGLRWKQWAPPFLVIGSNPIAVFVGSALLSKILLVIKVSDGGAAVNPVVWLHGHFFAPLAGPVLGSLIYAVVYVLLWIGLAAPLYKHRLFLKI
ncbi:MAG: heparan-alpha-glucosaminide N-acetyltransferase domain-containing protein [Candidatus Aminicenantes bacterium]|nr:heparan-alpha-glucosaminide N-acetyltransferase domain-containing protein [Candidatus Aminicenantes bacterium]